VFLKDAEFMQDTHGIAGCVICHGGDSRNEDKEMAHEGLVVDPSESSCYSCHGDITHVNEISLHASLDGFKSVISARGGNLEEGSPLATAFENHCQQCHTSCGQCHVSRPHEMAGGLVSSHEFKKPPSMQYNCVACHGARVGDEYLGENEGIPGDVHWLEESMTCSKCHGQELHGSAEPVATRYLNPEATSCESEDCHADIRDNTKDHPNHEQHLSDLACQVCHSGAYKNCYNCHVAIDTAGIPCRTSDPADIRFKIGLNPVQSDERPYKYVVLRHVPICVGTYDFYGEDLLPEFDAVPTWKFATPHNIQLHTPQNESCNACHGNEDLYLTIEDIALEEREANRNVIVTEIPELVEEPPVPGE